MKLYEPTTDFTGDRCTTMACLDCENTWQSLDDCIHSAHYPIACPRCGSSDQTGPRWEDGDRCGNCGRVDYEFPITINGADGERYRVYCSRRCELQGEYAHELAKRSVA